MEEYPLPPRTGGGGHIYIYMGEFFSLLFNRDGYTAGLGQDHMQDQDNVVAWFAIVGEQLRIFRRSTIVHALPTTDHCLWGLAMGALEIGWDDMMDRLRWQLLKPASQTVQAAPHFGYQALSSSQKAHVACVHTCWVILTKVYFGDVTQD